MTTSATETKPFVPVAKTGELTNGTLKAVKAGDKELLLAMVANKYYSAELYCPHMGANLSLGKLEGTILTCPRHASKFDLIDGRVIRWTDWTGIKASMSKLFRSPRSLIMYPVKVEGDLILVAV
jgi:3-phenylpropionate/trans-cinnamate dioxygenase ferredoxin subunit